MKTRLIALALVALTGIGTATAQQIFQQVVDTNKLIIEDPQASGGSLSIAQFKYTAMQYLCTRAIKAGGGKADGAMLDRQAQAMNNFITGYITELTQAKESKKQKQVMMRYWKASAHNPMFNDPDTETTRAFTTDPTSITPFSLDTDWVKADEARKEQEK
ncbi:MAG: hypothetical protein UHL07_00910 [Bacteroidaceae bacterium]|nr:hypothetical protein [Bacteroidaceae bacterium]